jgi:hypothetical protein
VGRSAAVVFLFDGIGGVFPLSLFISPPIGPGPSRHALSRAIDRRAKTQAMLRRRRGASSMVQRF